MIVIDWILDFLSWLFRKPVQKAADDLENPPQDKDKKR